MLTATQIRKTYGDNVILDGVTLSLNPGERAGLVGPNGCGKTTLLRILAGIDSPDSGSVRKPNALRIGYLPQGLVLPPDETLAGYLDRAQGDLPRLTAKVERLAAALAQLPGDTSLHTAYDQALSRLAAAGEGSGAAIDALAALGLDHIPSGEKISTLSGGQKTRLALAGVLLGHPQLLLLDEPTNYLDLAMLEWLEKWLNGFRGVALVVSHDRAFLDRAVTRILELDERTRAIREYEGNYSAYRWAKAAERARLAQAYSDQEAQIAELRSAAVHLRGIARFRKGGKADSGDKFARGFFANRGAGTVKRAKQIERRIERLFAENRVEKPGWEWGMKLEFEPAASGNFVLSLESLSAGYSNTVILEGVNLQLWRGARAVITGANGSGKTTLLRTIAGALPPLAGRVRIGSNVRIGFIAQEQETLDPGKDALQTVQAEIAADETDARRFLHCFLFSGDDVFTPVGSLSYGERARLQLALLAARGSNFLLLDEPINHLDIPSRERFEEALRAFPGTVLAAVHDRYFIERMAGEVWAVGNGIVRKLG
ncbi:MAG: ABC-F family ATP-binding cassette domain-containing protein [Anaerolineales bacterium]|nr:ABC-F family ATP-binding cassette domain-containing protein [Anaerolineales bacterium]